jgi:Predicted membrane protein involved in D-alanine export
MLFATAQYLFAFLPLAVLAVVLAARLGGTRAALAVTACASLVFFGWDKPVMVGLLLASMAGNFLLGRRLAQGGSGVAVGVAANLALLGWFKYAGFLATPLGSLTGAAISLPPVVLPLAISFWTFQQIAWLVDCAKGRAPRMGVLDYAAFVAFFPQLLAGPIVRAGEMAPQYAAAFRPGRTDVMVGVALIGMGLFKKVALADGLAPYVDAVFSASNRAGLADAWGGALAYTLQIYFDFSGLADMALGSARLLGIRLPLNFDSPYKAASVSEFWKRWHVSLSRFLRDYLYIPLGGNRHGKACQMAALLVTMVLGGLWHGAGWTFVMWGALHGFYLVAFHLFRGRLSLPRPLAVLATTIAVAVAWVFFRATSFEQAWDMLAGMAGVHGATTSGGSLLDGQLWVWLAVLWAAVWMLPNSLDWLAGHQPALGLPERPRGFSALRPAWASMTAVLAVVAVLIVLHRGASTAPFLYMVF